MKHRKILPASIIDNIRNGSITLCTGYPVRVCKQMNFMPGELLNNLFNILIELLKTYRTNYQDFILHVYSLKQIVYHQYHFNQIEEKKQEKNNHFIYSPYKRLIPAEIFERTTIKKTITQ